MNLNGVFVRERGIFMNESNKGRFYHNGRFATLLDVVNHYNNRFNLNPTSQEKSDVVERVILFSLFLIPRSTHRTAGISS